jgi:hypothetical protein
MRQVERASLVVTLLVGVSGIFLYLAGTISIASQLHHAGVDPMDGFGLFSVSQILVRGIAIAVDPTVVGTALCLGLWGGILYLLRNDEDRPNSPPNSIRFYHLAGALVVAVLIAIKMVEAPGGEARAVYLPLLTVPALFAYFAASRQWMVGNVRWVVPTLLGATIVSLLMLAWVRPHPLPAIHIEMKRTDDRTALRPAAVNGAYVGYDGSVWFVQTGSMLRAIPAEDIAEVLID